MGSPQASTAFSILNAQRVVAMFNMIVQFATWNPGHRRRPYPKMVCPWQECDCEARRAKGSIRTLATYLAVSEWRDDLMLFRFVEEALRSGVLWIYVHLRIMIHGPTKHVNLLIVIQIGESYHSLKNTMLFLGM